MKKIFQVASSSKLHSVPRKNIVIGKYLRVLSVFIFYKNRHIWLYWKTSSYSSYSELYSAQKRFHVKLFLFLIFFACRYALIC